MYQRWSVREHDGPDVTDVLGTLLGGVCVLVGIFDADTVYVSHRTFQSREHIGVHAVCCWSIRRCISDGRECVQWLV